MLSMDYFTTALLLASNCHRRRSRPIIFQSAYYGVYSGLPCTLYTSGKRRGP
ncbi:hypothetical protein BDV29DRAFT_164809 [Aspergillus leporis]|uniref:Uncharacterized protein n=1 Tax=Aspergillus leporis TaxID=41062 RepID=A0A5N5XF17_9EURO|nr:hypothetical protein BDV29DRAFT_164809 [Aspergillus leporis]